MSEPERKLTERQADPFWLGSRWLKEVGPDGEVRYREVPLREEDLLFPEEEDRLVINDCHLRNVSYLKGVLDILMENRPGAKVFSDHRIDFGVEGINPLGPDVVVFVDLNEVWDGKKGTFEVVEFAARPLLVVEVTSPSTRPNDLAPKVDLYFEAKVPFYAIVDDGPQSDWSPVVLRGYRATPEGYSLVEPDEKGWLWLSPLNLWLVPDGEKVFLCSADGVRLPEWRETHAANKKAIVRIEELETLTEEAILARQEAERARADEIRKRADAEKREADEVLKRLDAEKREADEARKRADAETRAADLTALVAQLQAQLRQSDGSA